MTQDYYIKHNGVMLTDYGFAKLLFENVKYTDSSAAARVDAQLDWALKNCTNKNELNLSNGLQKLWYEFIGISSPSIWKYIDERIEELRSQRRVKTW